MIKLILKHKIIDLCLNTFFNSIIKEFSKNTKLVNPFEFDIKEGDRYSSLVSSIIHNDDLIEINTFTGVTVIDSRKYYIEIEFDYHHGEEVDYEGNPTDFYEWESGSKIISIEEIMAIS